MYSINLSPMVPLWLLAALAVVVVLAAIAAVYFQRGRGVLRAVALLAVLAALADPSLVHEEREPVKDVVAIVIDRSGSNRLADRTEQTQRARLALERQLASIPQVEPRFVEVGDGDGANDGTRLFEALNATLADVPAERVAGALFITDGIVHDMPAAAQALGLKAPLHALITGREGEIDRRVTLLDSPRFGIVGKNVTIKLRIDEKNGTGTSRIIVRRDGEVLVERNVRTGDALELSVRVDRGGPNLVEIEADALPNELTTANNRAVVTIEGVRDKLRVLLVSGEPHAGERTWRNLLKSDAGVDLVHFTILRPPEKQDGTPINQLSLIQFPTKELFSDKIKDFDLIIFDRYEHRGILQLLYYDNITRYVDKTGGALLVAGGDDYAGERTLYRTPLGPALPAAPTGRVIEGPFTPKISADGAKHPVTATLPGIDPLHPEATPPWGRWFRQAEVKPGGTGRTVLTGAENQPLLILDRKGKGRVALLTSDQAWLWARGYDGGGPHTDLLRRLAHWLMKEPELEEDRLIATAAGLKVTIERHSMDEKVDPVTLVNPEGEKSELVLEPSAPGRWRASVDVKLPGLYKAESQAPSGLLTAIAEAGAQDPREMSEVNATATKLDPIAQATGGGVFWTASAGAATGPVAVELPRITMMSNATKLAGSGWMGLKDREAFITRGVKLTPLFTGLLALSALLALLALAWWREGR